MGEDDLVGKYAKEEQAERPQQVRKRGGYGNGEDMKSAGDQTDCRRIRCGRYEKTVEHHAALPRLEALVVVDDLVEDVYQASLCAEKLALQMRRRWLKDGEESLVDLVMNRGPREASDPKPNVENYVESPKDERERAGRRNELPLKVLQDGRRDGDEETRSRKEDHCARNTEPQTIKVDLSIP